MIMKNILILYKKEENEKKEVTLELKVIKFYFFSFN